MNKMLVSATTNLLFRLCYEINKANPDVYFSINSFQRKNEFQINWYKKHGPIKTKIEPDKVAIKKAIKEGLTVVGATIIQSKNLQIK